MKETPKVEPQFPCKEIMPEMEFETSVKIDYKSVLNCSDQSNDAGE